MESKQSLDLHARKKLNTGAKCGLCMVFVLGDNSRVSLLQALRSRCLGSVHGSCPRRRPRTLRSLPCSTASASLTPLRSVRPFCVCLPDSCVPLQTATKKRWDKPSRTAALTAVRSSSRPSFGTTIRRAVRAVAALLDSVLRCVPCIERHATKFGQGIDTAKAACAKSLAKLGLDFVDLYLM